MDGIMTEEKKDLSKELIGEIKDFLKEAENGIQFAHQEIREDFDFYLGNQWDASDKSKLDKKGVPALSLNYIKKNVDVLSGFQRQNRTDIKVLPVEGSDELISEMLTNVMKWITGNQIAEHVVSDAFKDSLIGGLGWISPVMNYDNDMLNGDIEFRKISPYKMFIDPYTTERDLSDCGYIIVKDHKSRAKLMSMFPKFSKDIKSMSAVDPAFKDNANGVDQTPTITPRKTEKLEIIEYWRKVYNTVYLIVSDDGQMEETLDPEKAKIAKQDPALNVIERKIPEIRLSQIINRSLVVYDGDPPIKTKGFPFHPIFCFFTNTVDKWEDRIMGVVRPLKDPQREKNKRRSQIMQAINTSIHSGWIMDKNAVDDIKVLRNSSGAGKIIQKNPGKELQPVNPPNIPSSIIQLEMMFKDDLTTIGSNPDMLGLMQEKDTPGITIQLRQKQGMTSMQEPFDNLSFAVRMLGRQVLEIILKEWDTAKIKRILGDDLPFEEEKEIIREQMEVLKKQLGELPEHNVNPLPDPQNEEELALAQQQQMQDEDALAGQEQMKMQQDQMLEDLASEAEALAKEEQEFWAKYEEVKQTARFDCIVEESAFSPSNRIANFMLLNEMGRNGTPVPPEVLIELSDLPEQQKETTIQYIQAQQQMPQK
jgi:hypothetical protein